MSSIEYNEANESKTPVEYSPRCIGDVSGLFDQYIDLHYNFDWKNRMPLSPEESEQAQEECIKTLTSMLHHNRTLFLRAIYFSYGNVGLFGIFSISIFERMGLQTDEEIQRSFETWRGEKTDFKAIA